jgi:hypothetical protein
VDAIQTYFDKIETVDPALEPAEPEVQE